MKKTSHKKSVLNKDTRTTATSIFHEAVSIGVDFKLDAPVQKKAVTQTVIRTIIGELNESPESLEDVLSEFKRNILPYCTNFSSPNFLGFPDSGNSVAAITGNILADFLQQNIINQSFCAPSATFAEIAVIRWLRDAVGYKKTNVKNIWDVGGIVTSGGTASNTIGMMLAREHKVKGTLEVGVRDPGAFKIVVPKGIGHYSVKSAQMWLGCGHNLIEVDTIGFRYDIEALKEVLTRHKGEIMAVVAYAGDSRTMTIDNLDAVADLVRSTDPMIWLHADACHGFSLGFSSTLRHKIKGLEKFDSIALDPHKVMLVPYTLSALLVKNPDDMRLITSKSDLIMQEDFAFGQITPFMGSKPWASLKLWFMMKNYGTSGLDELITRRHELAQYLHKKIENDSDFLVINEVEINAVAFMYAKLPKLSIASLNAINKKIHHIMLSEGKFHLHQFSIPDSGIVAKNEILYPLRYMGGNPNTTEAHIDELIEYVKRIGSRVVRGH